MVSVFEQNLGISANSNGNGLASHGDLESASRAFLSLPGVIDLEGSRPVLTLSTLDAEGGVKETFTKNIWAGEARLVPGVVVEGITTSLPDGSPVTTNIQERDELILTPTVQTKGVGAVVHPAAQPLPEYAAPKGAKAPAEWRLEGVIRGKQLVSWDGGYNADLVNQVVAGYAADAAGREKLGDRLTVADKSQANLVASRPVVNAYLGRLEDMQGVDFLAQADLITPKPIEQVSTDYPRWPQPYGGRPYHFTEVEHTPLPGEVVIAQPDLETVTVEYPRSTADIMWKLNGLKEGQRLEVTTTIDKLNSPAWMGQDATILDAVLANEEKLTPTDVSATEAKVPLEMHPNVFVIPGEPEDFIGEHQVKLVVTRDRADIDALASRYPLVIPPSAEIPAALSLEGRPKYAAGFRSHPSVSRQQRYDLA